jgi:hypothetical protein
MRFRLAREKGCKKTGTMAGQVLLIKLSRGRSGDSKACWLIHNGLASAVVAVILSQGRRQLPSAVS